MSRRIVFLGTWAGMALVVLASSPAGAQSLVMTGAVPGTYTDISGTGTPLGLADDGVAQVWPGFDLNQTLFYGGGGGVWISNNGAIGFVVDGSSGAFYLNAAIPSFGLFGGAHGPPQALAVYWDDLAADTGDVYHATVGDPGERVFVVQWQDRAHFPGDGTVDGDEITFQVQIFEEAGPIKAQFLYADVDFLDPALNDGASATIGYQAGEIGNDVQWSYNQPGAVAAGVVLTLIELPGPCENQGDGNADCHIDLTDLVEFDVCLAGPAVPLTAGCECYDMDADGTVDLIDFSAFQRAFTGSIDTIPGCTP